MRQIILEFFTSTTAPRYLSAGGGWKVELLGSVAVAVDIGEILVVQVRGNSMRSYRVRRRLRIISPVYMQVHRPRRSSVIW